MSHLYVNNIALSTHIPHCAISNTVHLKDQANCSIAMTATLYHPPSHILSNPRWDGGCNSAGDFALCRTPLLVRLQERRQLLATPILMCLLKWKIVRKKADIISTRQKLQQDVGRFQAIKYSLTPKSRYYHGRRYNSMMGRRNQTARTLTELNMHVIL
jgi:hypothetical protein